MYVVFLFAANMSVIIMSLEFGRPFEIHVLWLLYKARHGTLQHYSHSFMRNNVGA